MGADEQFDPDAEVSGRDSSINKHQQANTIIIKGCHSPIGSLYCMIKSPRIRTDLNLSPINTLATNFTINLSNINQFPP
jgi:hypothetical protein